MLNEKLLEILSHETDGAVTIVSRGEKGAHLVNTWNSYIEVVDGDRLLIPIAGFKKTEDNLSYNNRLQLSICNREVDGYQFKGTGLIVEGKGEILNEGAEFDLMKEKFPWIRGILSVEVESVKQTL